MEAVQRMPETRLDALRAQSLTQGTLFEASIVRELIAEIDRISASIQSLHPFANGPEELRRLTPEHAVESFLSSLGNECGTIEQRIDELLAEYRIVAAKVEWSRQRFDFLYNLIRSCATMATDQAFTIQLRRELEQVRSEFDKSLLA